MGGRGQAGAGGRGKTVLLFSVCVYIYISYEERGQRELVGVKTGYDIVCC